MIKLRIVFFIGSMTSGGAERTVAALSKRFADLGHQVAIITFEKGDSFYPIDSSVKTGDLGGPRPSGNIVKAVVNNLKNVYYFRKEISSFRPDIVLCFSVSTLFTCVLASPFIVKTIVGLELSNPYISLSGSIWKPMKRIVSLAADGFIFQTERAMKYYPLSVQRKGIVIPNAVFVEDSEFENIHPTPEKIICAVGILREVKGFDILIKAFSLAADQIPDYKLVIYGEGEERENLQELVATLGLRSRVEMPGRKQDIIKEIAKASLFVLSSRHEGMPNVLIEAMACGLPCIATDCAMGPRELIEDGVNGVLVPVDDAKAMAEAILSLINNPRLALELGARARLIRRTNSIDVITRKWMDYLLNVHKDGKRDECSDTMAGIQ